MTNTTQHVDGFSVQRSEKWHSDLLKRLSSPYRDIRPEVLSESTFNLMSEIKKFRHLERHVYGSALDFDRTMENVERIQQLVPLFIQDYEIFYQKMGLKQNSSSTLSTKSNVGKSFNNESNEQKQDNDESDKFSRGPSF